MFDVLLITSTGVLNNIIQIIVGCLLSLLLYYASGNKIKGADISHFQNILIILLASLSGMLLPLTAYGLIPVLGVMFKLGCKPGSVIPLLVSNALFNTQIPFTDPSFIWRTGINRVIFAFVAGVCAGMIINKLNLGETTLLKSKELTSLWEKPQNISGMASLFMRSINTFGIYLVIGVTLDTILHEYVLDTVIDFVFTNPYTMAIPTFFSTYDVVNPFFLLTMKIVYMFLNLTRMSALLAVLKLKGFAAYTGYYSILAILLAIPAFV